MKLKLGSLSESQYSKRWTQGHGNEARLILGHGNRARHENEASQPTHPFSLREDRVVTRVLFYI